MTSTNDLLALLGENESSEVKIEDLEHENIEVSVATTMTKHQIKAAQSHLILLDKIHKQLESCQTLGCTMLEDVNASALESNAKCMSILEENLRIEGRLEEVWA